MTAHQRSRSKRSYPRALAAMLRDSPADALTFVRDIALAAAGGPRRVHHELIAWHRTVQVWQDPDLLCQLTASHEPDEYIEIGRPGS